MVSGVRAPNRMKLNKNRNKESHILGLQSNQSHLQVKHHDLVQDLQGQSATGWGPGGGGPCGPIGSCAGPQPCPRLSGQVRICNGAEWSWSDSELTSGRWLLPVRHLLTVCRTSTSLMFGSKVVILCSYWGLVLLGSVTDPEFMFKMISTWKIPMLL